MSWGAALVILSKKQLLEKEKEARQRLSNSPLRLGREEKVPPPVLPEGTRGRQQIFESPDNHDRLEKLFPKN